MQAFFSKDKLYKRSEAEIGKKRTDLEHFETGKFKNRKSK